MTSSALSDILPAASPAVILNPHRHARGDPTPLMRDDIEDGPSPDRVLNILASIQEEQTTLRNVLQGHQQTLLQKLDDLKLSKGSSTDENFLSFHLNKRSTEQHLAFEEEVEDLEEEAQKWFKNVHKDQIATLPRNELKELLNRWVTSAKPLFKDRQNLKSEEDVDCLIASVDVDASGMIDKHEFIKKIRMLGGGMVDGKFEPPQVISTLLNPEVARPRSLVERIVSAKKFNVGMSFVICANMVTMLVGLQLEGLYQGQELGLKHSGVDWPTYRRLFKLLETMYNTIYLLEFFMRLQAYGCSAFKHPSNMVDAIIVGISCLDSFVLQPSDINFVNVSVLRVFRIARCVRMLKILRFSKSLSELRVMVDTLTQAVRGVFWAMVLLGGIITAGGILMTQLTIIIVEEPDVNMDHRIWLYTYFGTVAVSMNTMFECTFSGHWWFYTRTLTEEIHYLFALFWICWVVLINFAAIRVIGAIFLKQTMNASMADAEKCAMVQLKHKGELSERLRSMFKAIDTSGDGAISLDEFDAMMSNTAVVAAFANMGLGVDQVTAFFSVLASDDDQADYNEFINGALAMATSSPILDTLKSLQNQLKMKSDVEEILRSVQPLKRLLPIEKP